MSLSQILGEDSDLVLHGLDDLFHPRVGPLLEDSFYPLSDGDHLFHGAASECLDFRRQRAIESVEKSINRVPLCPLHGGDAGAWRVSWLLPRAQLFLLSLF